MDRDNQRPLPCETNSTVRESKTTTANGRERLLRYCQEVGRIDSGVLIQSRMLFRRVVVEGRPQPSLDFFNAHALALVVVHHLVAPDLPQAEIARLRMRKVEPAHARSRPHRKRLRNQHSGIRLHVEQIPQRSLPRVTWAIRGTRRRSDPAILLLDQ